MMNKKRYRYSDVESAVQNVVRQDSCRMDDAMTGRILSHICDVAGQYKRRRKRRRVAVMVAAVVLLGVSSPLLYRIVAPSPGTAPDGIAVRPQAGEACPAQNRRVVLGNIDSTLESGFSPTPGQSYDAGDEQQYGTSLQSAYEYTACTDTL